MERHTDLLHILQMLVFEHLVETRHRIKIEVRGLEGLVLLLLLDSLVVVFGLNAGQSVVEVILVIYLLFDVLLFKLVSSLTLFLSSLCEANSVRGSLPLRPQLP